MTDSIASTINAATEATKNIQEKYRNSSVTPERYVFKSSVPSCTYVFEDGVVAHFIGGKYITNQKKRIDKLNEEVEAGHPHIYIDPNEVTAKEEDPANFTMEALKAKFFAEFQAQQQAQAANTDLGTSDTKLTNIANSITNAAVLGGSSSGTTAVISASTKLASLPGFIPASGKK